jgi:hypothetical protein
VIGWLLAWAVSYMVGAGWTFVGCLVLAVVFPRVVQVAFAVVVFPVYTLFFGTWAWFIGWVVGWHGLGMESWLTCLRWTAVPIGLLSWYFARSVRELGIDRLRGEE